MPESTILIAEDDDRLRAAFAVRLSHAGYRVVEATDGESAVALARTENPDVLVFDVHMPRTDGLTALEGIDAIESLRNCPVIYITGDHTQKTEAAAKGRGAFWVFHKPVDMNEFLELVGHLTGPANQVA